MMMPELISCFWRSSWSWQTRFFRKRAAGPVTRLFSLVRGEVGHPGGQELAVQDEIEGLRVQIRQEVHRQAGGRGFGSAAVQDQFHRRVTFQGEGQHDRVADEFLPVQDNGDADGFGGGGHISAVSHQLAKGGHWVTRERHNMRPHIL